MRGFLLPPFLLMSLLPARAEAQGARDPAAGLIRLADGDGNGSVAAGEWALFLGRLGADEAGALDARRVLARLAFSDQDGDGRVGRSDVEAALADPRATGLTGFFLAALADGDGDGAVSEAEGRTFAERAGARAPPDGTLPEEVLVGWVRALEALPPPPAEDRGRMVPPVVLAGMLPALDADANGTLTLDDLNALHRGADANGDGAVTAEELAASRGPVFTRWEVDPKARERPPLMPWQRTLEDALALVRSTGKPLLVCVNMDGENASENLAYGRYRDPAFAALASGFVPVLASPDRREPLERDDRGRRLPDRRFGRLLNSEHIGIEPELFARYFRENRVAPRHLGVGPDGEILFDLYLLQDLSLIDAKIREFGVATAPPPDPAGRSEDELLASPDAADRAELERRFAQGGEALRLALAPRALDGDRAAQHPELVHLALRDPSAAVRRLGALELASDPAAFPLELAPAALGEVAGDARAEEELLAGLARAAGGADERRAAEARLLGRACAERRTLEQGPMAAEVRRWKLLLEAARPASEPALGAADLDPTIAQLDRVDAELRARRDDAALLGLRLELLVRLARIRMATGENPVYDLQDAERAADAVLARAPEDGRALGLKAWSHYGLNKVEEAGEAAERALPHLLRDAGAPLAGEVLRIRADARTRALYDALSAGRDWPEGGAAEALMAHELLLAHPSAGEDDWVRTLELLGALRAFDAQRAAVLRGLERLPTAERLHSWLRFAWLRDRGARALEAAYGEEPLASAPAGARSSMAWFHGLATLFAAEHDVRCRDLAAARAAYARCAQRFAASAEAEPAFAASAGHYRCLALAGLSRLELADGRPADAAQSLIAALQAAPGSAEQKDGLSRSPADTARELLAHLRAHGPAELARSLSLALDEAGFSF